MRARQAELVNPDTTTDSAQRSRQVFVFSEQVPFDQHLERRVCPQIKWEPLGWETNLDRAIWRIHMLHPPAVIVANPRTSADCVLAVDRLRTECPDIQIFEIDLETPAAHIQSGQQQVIQELRQLITALEGFRTEWRSHKAPN